eukprot:ANDGO_03886.mRNA.1 hypothetical protein
MAEVQTAALQTAPSQPPQPSQPSQPVHSQPAQAARYRIDFSSVLAEVLQIHSSSYRHSDHFSKAADNALRAFEFRRRSDADTASSFESIEQTIHDIKYLNVPPLSLFDTVAVSFRDAVASCETIRREKKSFDDIFSVHRASVERKITQDQKDFQDLLQAKSAQLLSS